MTDSGAPALPKLADFPFRDHDTIRYGDTDKLGHVNNAVFSTYLETGRAKLLLNSDPPLIPPGTGFALVRLVLDFRAEMLWPGIVEVGTRVVRLGRSSVYLEQALFQDGTCTATAETVLVLMDLSTRRSTPLTDDLRERFAAAGATAG